MAKSFGQTWWGERWLDALTHIDYANRIPRGASYARKGAVKEIIIAGGNIQAKVSGSSPRPYRIKIGIPQFTDADKERLMTEVLRQPTIISKLLNRELDPGLMEIADRLRLKLFPRSWNDLEMQCSCPDWAVPCKHIAAVIYKVGQEIDNNPFLVFELHGIDLLKELERRGIRLDTKTMLSPIGFDELIVPEKKKKAAIDAVFAPDYTTLGNIGDTLVSLLPDHPAFYASGNFHAVYAKHFARCRRYAQKLADGSPTVLLPLKSLAADVHPTTSIMMCFDNTLRFHAAVMDNDESVRTVLSVTELCATLLHIDPDTLGDCQPQVELLHRVMQLAIRLWAAGAVVSQIMSMHHGKYAVRWLPAVLDEHVARWMEELEAGMPGSLLCYKEGKAERGIAHAALWLVSLLLGEIARQGMGRRTLDDVEDMFFYGEQPSFDGIGEKGIPGGIKVWTDRFFLGKSPYCPVFLTDETDEGFALTISMEDTKTPQAEAVPLQDILQTKKYDRQRFEILKGLSILSDIEPRINAYINSGADEPIRFTLAEFTPFLLKAVPMIRILQAKVMLPKSLGRLLRPKVSVKLSRRDEDGRSFIRMDELLMFDWQVAIGDELLSPAEFDKLMQRASGLIRYKQQYIYVSEDDLGRIHKALSNAKPLTAAQMLQAALAGEYEAAPITMTKEVEELIRELTRQADIPLPDGLNATLRPYQERGFSWMYRNMRIGFGSIIADDMGLGKTLQVITLLLKLKQENAFAGKKALVVAPTGLLSNWQNEISRFAPMLTVAIYHGTGRSLDTFDADILLTSYGVLRSDSAELKKKKWEVMVIDEAQNIKNQTTAQSKAVRSIPAATHIAMSGTPVENRLTEFWTIMDFVNKGYLGNAKQFKERFASPIQGAGDKAACERFRAVTAPFMMRRLKTDKSIIDDLPDKIERNEFALLTASQAALYQQTLEAAMTEIEGIDEHGDAQTLFKRQGLVLQMILALKQICNHPTQFLKNGKFDPALSGKTVMLLDLVQSIVESREKVLIFTQFREMGDMLVRFIGERIGREPLFYHGGCSVKQRNALVERFQNNRTEQVFILSLKAAGTGLNLTAASHVIHYDLWWNPAVEAQATDRAYRIGQHKNVVVRRFITRNTFEEKIDRMIQEKRHLAELTVASGENWIGKLSNKELRELFVSE